MERRSICAILKEKNVRLLPATIPIKSLSEGTKFLHSLISPGIKEGDCSDAWIFFARHCVNDSSQIQDFGFDKSYSSVAHAYSFRLTTYIAAMHRLAEI